MNKKVIPYTQSLINDKWVENEIKNINSFLKEFEYLTLHCEYKPKTIKKLS